MGYYINPPSESKEAWLEANGEKLPDNLATQRTILNAGPGKGSHFVCLVDNGPFTAAGIAYDDREKVVFMTPDGAGRIPDYLKTRGDVGVISLEEEYGNLGKQRPRTWYLVRDEMLINVCPRVESVLS